MSLSKETESRASPPALSGLTAETDELLLEGYRYKNWFVSYFPIWR